MTCMCVCLQSMVILEVLEFSGVTWSQSQAPNTVELMHGKIGVEYALLMVEFMGRFYLKE